jgi:hypothetical protein
MRVTDKFWRGVAEAPEPTDGREAPSTSGENPGGIFERVPEKIIWHPLQTSKIII